MLIYTDIMTYQIQASKQFIKWLKGLKDKIAKARILARIETIELLGNFGDFKSVGNSVYELRIYVGKGYRVYYTINKSQVVFLLGGGTKDTQSRDIEKCKKMIKE